jgi:ADP-ribosyl-[dinitrogen reductase] hydrolase
MQMLGTIIGDIAGSAYEFANLRAKDFQPFFHPKARFTNDTVFITQWLELAYS